jgi:hypothetical protein
VGCVCMGCVCVYVGCGGVWEVCGVCVCVCVCVCICVWCVCVCVCVWCVCVCLCVCVVVGGEGSQFVEMLSAFVKPVDVSTFLI